MKKFWKRFIVFSLIIFSFIFTIVMVLTAIFEEKIGKTLISEINKQIESELTVEKFDLSILRNFPNVASNLRGVVLNDTEEAELLKAKNLSFRFGLLSLLSSSIKIKSVLLSDATINVHIDKNGHGNYDIFKKTEKDSEKPRGEGPTISLETARLKNVIIDFKDDQAKNDISTLVADATFSGEFTSKKFTLSSNAKLFSHYIKIKGLNYLPKKELSYDAKVNIDLAEKVYEIEKFELDLESNLFQVDGTIESWENGTNLELSVASQKAKLESIFKLLPKVYTKDLENFRSAGNFVFNAQINGLTNATRNPKIAVDLSLTRGKITSPQLNGSLKDVALNASFTNGKYRTNESSVFELTDFRGYFNRELLELQLKVANFDDPRINFLMDGVVPISSIYGLFGNPKISKGSGEIEIKNLKLNGRYKDMIRTNRIARVKAGGELEFDDVSLTINDEKLIIDRGTLVLENNQLNIDGLKVEGAGSELLFNGSAFNLIPVLFRDSLNSQRAELEFQADLQSKTLDIDRLLQYFALAEEETNASEPVVDSLKTAHIQKRERSTNLLKGTFNAVINEFNYNKIEGEEFVGQLEFNNNELFIDGNTKAMDGNFNLEGRVFFEDQPYLRAKLACDTINVKEFFRQAESFGQEVLTNKHVKGTLNARILINAYWDEEGNFLDDKLRVLAGFGIQNGSLVNFEMLENFSTFVKIRDLRHIKFESMVNFLEIRKRQLYLPAMFIQSNALNLTVSGEHSFDNEIKYNLKVNAGQVLVNRFKKHDKNLAAIPSGKKGFFNLFYSIAGDIDDYEIKSSKRQIKADFQRSAKRKRDILTALEKEFDDMALIRTSDDWGSEEELGADYVDINPEVEEEEDIVESPKEKEKPGKKVDYTDEEEEEEEEDTKYFDWEIEGKEIKKDTTKIKRKI